MRRLLPTFAFVAVFGLATTAAAQTYPSRPITMVVPLAPGGSTDVIARIMAEGMRTALGQTIVVENTTGAGGTIGIGRLARATPDGYTFGIGQWGTNVANGAVHNLPYDLLKDFEPIALIATQPFLIVARKTMPAENLKDLIAWLKANAGKASQGNSGIGTPSHVGGIFFQNAIGVRYAMVPYRSAGQSMQDLVAGNIDLNCDFASNSLAQYRNGNIKVYAVMANTRWAPAPEVPTTDEAGFPGIYISTWLGLWAPKNTPADIVAKVNAAALAAMADPGAHRRIADLGMQVPPPERLTPAAFAAFHRAEVEKWYPIVKAAGIKAE